MTIPVSCGCRYRIRPLPWSWRPCGNSSGRDWPACKSKIRNQRRNAVICRGNESSPSTRWSLNSWPPSRHGAIVTSFVARTDARTVEGMDAGHSSRQGLCRRRADVLFPEALVSAEEFGAFARELAQSGIHVPLIANMTEFGKTPYVRE